MSDTLGFLCFSGRLVLQTDLHIGDGTEPEYEDDGEPRRYSPVVRDWDGKPVIPGTALKGVLRAAVRQAKGDAEARRIFGEIKNSDTPGKGEGHIGRVTLYAAHLHGRIDSRGGLPKAPHNADTALATHVAIDRETGTADAAHRRLYSREIVPAGARFDLTGIAEGVDQAAQDALRLALAALASGFGIGRGTGRGNGVLKLEGGKVTVWTRRLDLDGVEPKVVEEGPAELKIDRIPASDPDADLELHCPGPFLSHDPARPQPQGRDNVLFALRRNDAAPLLWPESLYGVLRERCAWLALTGAGGRSDKDDPFRRALQRMENPSTLSRTERLFGVAGWRGLVRLEGVRLTGGERLRAEDNAAGGREGMAGINIDRFSGAVLDTGPFFADAWTGVTLTFSIRLERRGAWPSPDDWTLFRELLEEVRADGLLLGHGVNRGFGWFEPVKVEIRI